MSISETSPHSLPEYWHMVRDEQTTSPRYRRDIAVMRKKIATQIAQSLMEISEPPPALTGFLEKILTSSPIKIFSDGENSIIRFEDPHARLPGRLESEKLRFGEDNGYVPLVDKQGRAHLFVRYDGVDEEEATKTVKLLTNPSQFQLLDGGALGQRILYIAIQKDNEQAVKAARFDTPLPSKGDLTRSLQHFLEREAELVQQCLDAENAELDRVARQEARKAKKERPRPSAKKEDKKKKPKISKSNADLLEVIAEVVALQEAKAQMEQTAKITHHRWLHEQKVTKKLKEAVDSLAVDKAPYNKTKSKRAQLERSERRVEATHKEWQSQQSALKILHAKCHQASLQKPASMVLPPSVQQLFSLQATVDFLRDEQQSHKMAIRTHKQKIAHYDETIEEYARKGETKNENRALHSLCKTKKALQYARSAAKEITRRVKVAEIKLQNHIDANDLGHIQSRPPEHLRAIMPKRLFIPHRTRGVPVQAGRLHASALKS